MRFVRLLAVLVVTAAVVGLLLWLPDSAPPESVTLDRPTIPAVFESGAPSATWYCAASSFGTPEPPAHEVVLTNSSGSSASARLTPFGQTAPAEGVTVDVPANGATTVDLAQTFLTTGLSILVESPAPGLVVEHRLSDATAADQVPCATLTSNLWWFPALNSSRGATALLTLFNPFPTDAGVDVEVVLDASARTPAELSGIVVPPRSIKVVDVGAVVQRRDVFAIVVRSRSGRVVAEATQFFDGSAAPRGLRMNVGVAGESPRWVFAGGFTGEGVAETAVVVNPGTERVSAEIRVTPYGGSATAPEPIVLDIPPLRYGLVDLSAEGRIPPIGYHSVTVETDGAPVVASLLTTITGPPAAPADPAAPAPDSSVRPALGSGVGIATGSPVAAGFWIVPALDASAVPAPVVFVHNPFSTPVNVAVVPIDAGLDPAAQSEATTEVEIQAHDSVALTVPAASVAGQLVGLRLSAMAPFVVERLVTYPGQDELATGSAVPGRSERSGPVLLPALRPNG
ncbi:MAG: DUF5719 family protein [Actinomycetota bacterium]